MGRRSSSARQSAPRCCRSTGPIMAAAWQRRARRWARRRLRRCGRRAAPWNWSRRLPLHWRWWYSSPGPTLSAVRFQLRLQLVRPLQEIGVGVLGEQREALLDRLQGLRGLLALGQEFREAVLDRRVVVAVGQVAPLRLGLIRLPGFLERLGQVDPDHPQWLKQLRQL